MGSVVDVKEKNRLYALLKGEEEEEKWHMHYSSFHEILLVGEGDFSFSLCLANSFGSASNIVATSFDSYDALIQKYKYAEQNVERLEKLGATVLHGVDATAMQCDTDICMKKFDRIVYNFPHAGFHGKETDRRLLRKHRSLVCGFLGSAESMLRPDGEIHVNHKTAAPFSNWNLEELASWKSLTLLERVDFKIQDFPGYKNKRGDGKKCDESFPLGNCSTFKFVVSPTGIKMSKGRLLSLGIEPFQMKTVSVVRRPPSPPTLIDVDHVADKYTDLFQRRKSKGRRRLAWLA